MNVSSFFDTNVLIYAFHPEGYRSARAQDLLAQGGTISVQSLSEFVSVVRRKFAMGWKEVNEAVIALEILCPSPRSITGQTHRKALQIAERYGYRIYDSLIVASALEAKCKTLYSEDMQDGQVIDEVTIRNPFAAA